MCAGHGIYRDRNFRSGVPVMVTDRFLRADLLVHPALKSLFLKLIARYAGHCQVDVVGFALLSNHLHLVVRQRFAGRCPRRVLGISCFMRNLKSAFSNAARRLVGIRGPKFESRFKSHELASGLELLASMAYVHGQQAHHRLGEGIVLTSRDVFDGARDVVTVLPDLPQLCGATFADRLASLGRLLDQIAERYVQLRSEDARASAAAPHGLRARAHRLAATLELAGAIADLEAESLTYRPVPHLPSPARVTLPALAATHELCAGRIVRTKLVGEGATCWIEWALRTDAA